MRVINIPQWEVNPYNTNIYLILVLWDVDGKDCDCAIKVDLNPLSYSILNVQRQCISYKDRFAGEMFKKIHVA